MTNFLKFNCDGWLNYPSDGDDDGMAITRLRVSVGEALITRNLSKRAAGESEAINVSILPLAEFLANSWWPLLYEPLKPSITKGFRIRHRLDSGMRGYSFPALALCSGGEKSIVVDWTTTENVHSPISFLTPAPAEPIQLDREQAEIVLLDLVESALERLSTSNLRRQNLKDAWDRIKTTMAEPDELNYCMVAGRLGLDPYDPDSPDLTELAAGIPDQLFDDLSDAVELEELDPATKWLRNIETRLALFPEIGFKYFGDPVVDDLNYPAWTAGEGSAIALLTHSGFRGDHPKVAVEELFGGAVHLAGKAAEVGPKSLNAVVRRSEDSARIATIAKSARQRRFRGCAAAYLAWTSQAGEDRASTEALTRRQQASRAFAAEMLAPKDALLAKADRYGFDDDDLEEIASEFVCPYTTVMWQAHRAGIPLRGVDLPFLERVRII